MKKFIMIALVVCFIRSSFEKSISNRGCSSNEDCQTENDESCDIAPKICKPCSVGACHPNAMKIDDHMCRINCPGFYWKLTNVTSPNPLDEATDTVIGGERNTSTDDKSPNIILIVSLSAFCLSVITVVVLTYLLWNKMKLYADKLCTTVKTSMEEDGDNIRTNNSEKQPEEDNLQRLLNTPKEQV